MQDLDPSDICKKKILNPLKRIRVIIRTATHGRTDGRTDGQTDRQTDGRTGWIQYTPPKLRFGGYNNKWNKGILVTGVTLGIIIFTRITLVHTLLNPDYVMSTWIEQHTIQYGYELIWIIIASKVIPLWGIEKNNSVTKVGHGPSFNHQKYGLWVVYWEYMGKYWMCYNDTTLIIFAALILHYIMQTFLFNQLTSYLKRLASVVWTSKE